MRTLSRRAAAFVGLLIGGLSVAAGLRVLLAVDEPSYVVLPALVWYNALMGVVSVVAAFGLLRDHSWATTLAALIFMAHGAVLTILLVRLVMGSAVAAESVGAMMFRAAAWAAIGWNARRTEIRPAVPVESGRSRPGR